MSMSSPAPPTVYNPFQVAAGQQDINLQSAAAQQAASNVNQYTPYGSLTYEQTGQGPGGIPTYTAKVQLTPAQQQLVDTLQRTQGISGQQAQDLIRKAGYGGQNPADVIGGMTSGTTGELLKKETDYLNPFFGPQIDQLDAKLRNQGLHPGTPAYDQAMNNLRQSQGQTVTGFLAQAEPAAYAQAVQSYGLPLATAQQLMGMSQPTGPTFVNTPTNTMQPANAIGAAANAQNADVQRYAAEVGQQNAMMSGMFQIPAAVLGGWARAGKLPVPGLG